MIEKCNRGPWIFMISVVIPTKNRSEKLARALASVRAQTDPNYEIIVVDDGSGIDESKRIQKIVEETPRAQLIRNVFSIGAPLSRNTGVHASSGNIIALLDSDDWWQPERLAIHRKALNESAAVLSYNRAHLIRDGANDVFHTYGQAPDVKRPLPISLAGWNFVGGCSSVCVTRQAFDLVGGFDATLPSCQDWELWCRIAQVGKFSYIHEALTYQDCGPHERITTSNNDVEVGHKAMEDAADRLKMSAKDRRYVRAHQHRTRAEIALRFGRTGRAFTELLRSLLARPTCAATARIPTFVFRITMVLFSRAWRTIQ